MTTSNSGTKRLRDHRAETAIILGSGLSSFVVDPAKDQIIPYAEFSEIPKPSVPGHLGRFVLGEMEKTKIIFAQGRVHLYEGHSAREVTSIVRVLAEAGIKQLIVTNAAGALNPKFKPGDWMMITDHINLTGTSPLLGSAKFLDLIALHEGVYAGGLGPQYETPAEVRMLRKLGADAVGMSTVLEVIQARALGLEVAGFSCLTNLAAGLSQDKLSHEEVLDVGKRAAADFANFLTSFCSA
jgi:purine-nucleoside phosphorylase